MHSCEFWGSTLADRKCYFCEKYCCTTCMTDDRTDANSVTSIKENLGSKNY